MINQDITELLDEIAEMLEMKGESSFKVRAYHEAARQVEHLHEDIATVAAEGRLTEIRGVGTSIAEKISEYLETGHSSYHDELAAALPPDLYELTKIPGVGAKKGQVIYEKLGVSSVDELEQAAKEHKLRELPGMKEKTEQNILEGIQRYRQRTARMPLSTALPVAEEIVDQLRENPAVEQVELGGSIRRMKETIGDIDILAASSKPDEAIRAFVDLAVVKSVEAKGSTKASVVTRDDLQVDLRVVSPDEWGAALQYFTGSKEHNIQLRTLAEGQGLKVNEYGVFRVDSGERVAGRSEEEVYRALGMEWMPPEMREAEGEIEAALEGKLPDLIDVSDLRGDLHVHTNWTDGSASIEAMAEAAVERGYEYLVIADHSVSMGFINGLTIERVREQRKVIDELNRGYRGFRLLHGTEMNIHSDGTLDYPDDVLAEFDVVTASLHGGLRQGREQITHRLVSAIRNPHVDIIGHPSGRLINRRDPSDFDKEAVFKAAAQTGTALEVNSQPDRLDLKDEHARRAVELGVRLAIDSDAHATWQLELVRYGVATARRGWVEKKDVVNAMGLAELLCWTQRNNASQS